MQFHKEWGCGGWQGWLMWDVPSYPNLFRFMEWKIIQNWIILWIIIVGTLIPVYHKDHSSLADSILCNTLTYRHLNKVICGLSHHHAHIKYTTKIANPIETWLVLVIRRSGHKIECYKTDIFNFCRLPKLYSKWIHN